MSKPATKERQPMARLNLDTDGRLERLAASTGETRTSLLETAVKMLEEKLFWDAWNRDFDRHATELKAEYELFEGANVDALEVTA